MVFIDSGGEVIAGDRVPVRLWAIQSAALGCFSLRMVVEVDGQSKKILLPEGAG
jgi:hypothetical protein